MEKLSEREMKIAQEIEWELDRNKSYSIVVYSNICHEEDWKCAVPFTDVGWKLKERFHNGVGSFINHGDGYYTNLVRFKMDEPDYQLLCEWKHAAFEIVQSLGYEDFIGVTIEEVFKDKA
jgi:hypothetical protein